MVEALNELSPSSKKRAVQAYDCQARLSSKAGIESRLDKWHAATPSGLAFVFMQAGPRKDQLFTLSKGNCDPVTKTMLTFIVQRALTGETRSIKAAYEAMLLADDDRPRTGKRVLNF